MMDSEKFEGFKQRAIQDNEAAYGPEIRQRYGDQAVNAANARLAGMTQAQYVQWKALEDEIRRRLESAVIAGQRPDGPEGREIVRLHRQWLSYTWDAYSPAAHRGLAAMYAADERFQAYYDSNQPGCTEFLVHAINADCAPAGSAR